MMAVLFKTDVVTGVRRLFYMVTPNETYAEHVTDVTNYIQEAASFLMVAVLLESLVLVIKGNKGAIRITDGLSSMTAGMFMMLVALFIRGFDIVVFAWLHYQFPSLNLRWNSSLAWFICFFGVDMCYYWFHRMAHEVNILWAAHQVHHSSEDYNLSTALRQSLMQRLTSWLFYLPLSVCIPPAMIMVHVQFNTLYQFWIHTELIDNIGPLEYILNTPSHHRVHHGRNRYCIDKNYAGTLIIFDRMFGTFVAEKKDDKVVYGLVHPLASFNPIYTQFGHLQWMWQQFWEVKGAGNKLSVIFKGPGWEPGKPRTGLIEDIPDIHYPQRKYNPKVPLWGSVYILIHFVLIFLVFQFFSDGLQNMTPISALAGCAYLIFSFTCIGAICDIKWYAPILESLRCLVVLSVLTAFDDQLVSFTSLDSAVFTGVRVVFLLSAFMWLPQCIQQFSSGKHIKHD